MTLPLLLVGPLVRRSEPQRICVWLATSKPVDGHVVVYDLAEGRRGHRFGSGGGRRVQLGENLFVHLLEARPSGDSFPTHSLLGYDIELQDGDSTVRLTDLGLLEGPQSVAYEGLALPSLWLQSPDDGLTVMHGSCRKLSGHGSDGLALVDVVLARHARDLSERPSALFLTGDQIYADDVAGPLMWHLHTLGGRLLGYHDQIPGLPRAQSIPLYERRPVVSERANFTSPKAENHLMTLGEFAATYVLSWSPECWPQEWPDAEHVIDSRDRGPATMMKLKRRYAAEVRRLERTRSDLWRVRRALANVPTYTVFDDHDVTDDWNITKAWQDSVRGSPGGRRIVANALATYWAFQGWGNAPDVFDEELIETVSAHATSGAPEVSLDFENLLWDFERWCYCAPTSPPALCLDTRTMRAYDAPEGGARLLGKRGREISHRVAVDAGHSAGEPMVLISPVPVCGLELQERRQKFLVGKVGPYEIDFEAWHSNLQGFVDFMTLLVEDLKLPWVAILSGDVHYGMTIGVQFVLNGRELPVSQFVASSFRHSGAVSKAVLTTVGRLVRSKHDRVGWQSPPECERSRSWRNRLMLRAANTDEWRDDAPVSVAPKIAEHLKVEKAPDFEEHRLYVRPEGTSSMLIGDNNVGVVRIHGTMAEQTMLTDDPGVLRKYKTALDLRTARPPDNP